MKIDTLKKWLKIITINILILVIAVCTVDFLLYTKYKNEYIKQEKEKLDIFPPISYIDNYRGSFSEQSYMFYNKNKNNFNYFRKTSEENHTDKKSILIFGCSFAYSFGLEDNQTINNKLSLATKRNVYNFAICACGIQHMFELIKNPELYNKIKDVPEHLIYIFIPSHLERLQANIFPSPMMTNGINLKYELKNNELKLQKEPLNIFSKSFIVKSLYYQMDLKRKNDNEETKKYNAELAKRLFIESRKEIRKKYPNIKYTILRYETEEDNGEFLEIPQMWEELEKEGFIILKTSDLIGRKYKYHSEDTNEDFYHPSEYAFDLLIPPLAKELNL